MKKKIIPFMVVFLLFLIFNAWSASARDIPLGEGSTLQSMLSAVNVTGGISAGYFHASNPGEDTSSDAFLLSNFLVEIFSADEDLPVCFAGAFGETSTPSILGAPENNTDFKIEYASLKSGSDSATSLEVGLLQPNAGFENTYTFNNNNVILGAVASQQPYNAYGARMGYDVEGLSLWGGYYRERLDDEEYNSPDYAWELGLSVSIAGDNLSVYNYHIDGQRNLLGAVLERTTEDIEVAFNIDYWTWDNNVKDLYGDESSIGVAVYICPKYGYLSIPFRFEYINQDKSQIYIDSPDAKKIYTATVSPTYQFNESSYIRTESSYVKADGGFVDKGGHTKDSTINFAVELGFLF